MIPTVSQQIFAIRNSMAKTVIPALSPNEKFAAEQANLIVASLDWLLDAHESEHRYEMVELGITGRSLQSWLNCGRVRVFPTHAQLWTRQRRCRQTWVLFGRRLVEGCG